MAVAVGIGLVAGSDAWAWPVKPSAPIAAPAEDEGEVEEEEAEEAPPVATVELEPPPSPRKVAAKGKKTGNTKASSSVPKKPKGDKRCEFRTPIFEHVVREGEHLGLIASKYGVRANDIKKLNPKLKANPNLLRVGEKLLVCPEVAPHVFDESTYVVKKGDSLSEIAEKHGMTVRELVAKQKPALRKRLEQNPKGLQPGDELVVLVDRGVAAAFAPPEDDHGVLKVGIQLEPGKHYYIKRPHLAYGTHPTIKAIKAAISRYAQVKGIKGGPLVHIGDISARGGGPLRGHKSHQKGVDVDVGLVLRGPQASEVRFLPANADNLDVPRTWALIKAFIDTNEVRAIFLDYGLQKLLYDYAKKKGVKEAVLDELFQYPRGKGRNFGIIRHWKGHRDHFHVRFRR
ncbi:MAG TPA: penicillin-insensitive murein endopeptidase [Nannocystis sp.]